jgi:hypothetical protein
MQALTGPIAPNYFVFARQMLEFRQNTIRSAAFRSVLPMSILARDA